MKEIEGNLLDLFDAGEFDVIVHGCNCFHTMGAGIARQIANRYPQAKQVDLQTPLGISKLGTISFINVPNKTTGIIQTVVNAYTQRNPGKEESGVLYASLVRSMAEIKEHFQHCKIGLPRIGCGIAGGDWAVVRQIIEFELSGLDVTIVHYNYKAE